MLNTMGHFTNYDLLLDTLFMTVAADTVALVELFEGLLIIGLQELLLNNIPILKRG